MALERPFTLQFYRREAGDQGINDMPHTDEGTLESVLTRALLGLHNNETIAPEQRPNRARALGRDGLSVVCELEVLGPDKVFKRKSYT